MLLVQPQIKTNPPPSPSPKRTHYHPPSFTLIPPTTKYTFAGHTHTNILITYRGRCHYTRATQPCVQPQPFACYGSLFSLSCSPLSPSRPVHAYMPYKQRARASDVNRSRNLRITFVGGASASAVKSSNQKELTSLERGPSSECACACAGFLGKQWRVCVVDKRGREGRWTRWIGGGIWNAESMVVLMKCSGRQMVDRKYKFVVEKFVD